AQAPYREESFMSNLRQILAALALVAGVSALAAQDSSKEKDAPREGINGQIAVENTAVRQAQLKRSFEQFRSKLAVLAGRLESSPSTKDQEKAKAMRAALKEASERATEMKFDSLIRSLSSRGADQNLDVLNQAIRENRELR